MHLEPWKTQGNLGLLAVGIKYLEKSAKGKREEKRVLTNERFRKSVVFQYNLPHE